jgi:hypothetical protein
MKNSNETIGKPTRNRTACRAVPQPTAPPVKWSKPVMGKLFKEGAKEKEEKL